MHACVCVCARVLVCSGAQVPMRVLFAIHPARACPEVFAPSFVTGQVAKLPICLFVQPCSTSTVLLKQPLPRGLWLLMLQCRHGVAGLGRLGVGQALGAPCCTAVKYVCWAFGVCVPSGQRCSFGAPVAHHVAAGVWVGAQRQVGWLCQSPCAPACLHTFHFMPAMLTQHGL